MCRLFETINISNGKINNINFHNARFNESREILFGCKDLIDLCSFIEMPSDKLNKFKCRIVYAEEIYKVEISIYNKRKIHFLKTVFSDTIEYEYKFEDRSKINELFMQRENCDDIMIIKNKKVTDTSFSNIVFSDGKKLYTPSSPILKGTRRNKLLQEGILQEADIYYKDIKKFKKIILINSMLDLEDKVEVKIRNIIF